MKKSGFELGQIMNVPSIPNDNLYCLEWKEFQFDIPTIQVVLARPPSDNKHFRLQIEVQEVNLALYQVYNLNKIKCEGQGLQNNKVYIMELQKTRQAKQVFFSRTRA